MASYLTWTTLLPVECRQVIGSTDVGCVLLDPFLVARAVRHVAEGVDGRGRLHDRFVRLPHLGGAGCRGGPGPQPLGLSALADPDSVLGRQVVGVPGNGRRRPELPASFLASASRSTSAVVAEALSGGAGLSACVSWGMVSISVPVVMVLQRPGLNQLA